ncbi:GSCOCG00012294001-RA-CDS [Cotesia congregata]|nr:GSCOCG00012294001-RA-CDS [Cotesia congregata]
MLEAIGKRIDEEKKTSPAIHNDIFVRWKGILKEGLPTEERELLFKKYPTPENCLILEPQKLNAQIKASLLEPLINKDKRLIEKQRKVCVCLSALGSVLSDLLKGNTPETTNLVATLSDTARVLVDLQRDESLTRRLIISANINPALKETLNATKTVSCAQIINEQGSSSVQEINSPVSVPAGRLRHFLPAWEELFGNNPIIEWVKGYKIPFSKSVYQPYPPRAHSWSSKEYSLVSEQINELIVKGAIEECINEPGQFISKIFLTEHFKLEDLRTVRELIYNDCFMATLDLKDAYYLIPIAEEYKKYLKFEFGGKLYQFTCLPFGLNTAPYVFTKLLKPVFTWLRQRGFISVVYLDDVWLLGESEIDCINNLFKTRKLLEKLGFIINEVKSQLSPSKECRFLGFIISSAEMRIKLPEEKRSAVKSIIKKFENSRIVKFENFPL